MTTNNQGPECPFCGYTENMVDVKIEDGYSTVYACSSCGYEFHSRCLVDISWETEKPSEMVGSL